MTASLETAIARALEAFEQELLAAAGIETLIDAAGGAGKHVAVYTGKTRAGEARALILVTRIRFSEVLRDDEVTAALEATAAENVERTRRPPPGALAPLSETEILELLADADLARARVPAIILGLQEQRDRLTDAVAGESSAATPWQGDRPS